MAGAVTFGVSWGLAALADWALLSNHADDNECPTCKSGWSLLFVPVAGPLITAVRTNRDSTSGLTYTVLGAWSLVEAAGAALLIAGIVGHDVPKPPAPHAGPTVSLIPAFSPQLGAVALNVTW